MPQRIILASRSPVRADLLRKAGVRFEVMPARIDETAVKQGLEAENASPRDIADTLAEYKARKISAKHPDDLILGCDQVAELDGQILSKPVTPHDAKSQLRALSGKTHKLLSAAVLCHKGQPVWRHIGVVRLTMRKLSAPYIDDYVERNWESIRESVGAYKLEEEGARLISLCEGDYFNVLGLPLQELISFFISRELVDI